MSVINMTPHDICIIQNGKEVRVIPASGQVARCEMLRQPAGSVEDIPVFQVAYGTVQGLPEPEAGVWYIVSNLVAQILRGTRQDLLVPVDFVRDNGGRITGCQALAHIGTHT